MGYGSGFPVNSTFGGHIIQDSIGFFWIASFNGLFQYEGYRVKLYESDKNDSLSVIPGTIKQLLLDNENNLWVITENGLSMYIRDKDMLVNYNIFSVLNLPLVRSYFAEDKNRLFWITTQAYGLISFYR